MKALTPAILLGGALFASTFTPAFADSQSPPHVALADLRSSAPLDEYFGPLRMSPLGIRNDLASQNAQLDAGASDQATLLKHTTLVERAIRDWEVHYPGDRWLPDAIANLHTVYAKAAGHDAKLHAIDAATWLIARYPASDEAKAMRDDLASALDSSDASPNDPNASPGEIAPPAETGAPNPSLAISASSVAAANVANPTNAANAVAPASATKTVSAWQRFHAARVSSR